MWVKFKKTYSGPAGLFAAGSRMDLPKEKVAAIRAAIGEKNIIETCPPWEDNIDKNASARNKLHGDAAAAIKKAEYLSHSINELSGQIKAAQQKLAGLQKEQRDANNKAKELAKKAGIDWSFKTKDAGSSGQ